MNRKYHGVWINMTPQQFQEFYRQFSASECHSYSSFGRKMILREPINVSHRNKSFDEFIEETVKLRRDLRDLLEMGPLSPERQESLMLVLEKIKLATYSLADHVCKNWNHPES